MIRKIFAIIGALITGGLGIVVLVSATDALAFGGWGGWGGGWN